MLEESTELSLYLRHAVILIAL
uniref:Uncharacterized protein n=1 Tax=Arundo donax TaxID=35708 RepID=A0A0A9CCJ2_ARUDO